MGNASARCKPNFTRSVDSSCRACGIDVLDGGRFDRVVWRDPSLSYCARPGSYTYKVTVEDCEVGSCDRDTCSTRVTIVDTRSPDIRCPSNYILDANSYCQVDPRNLQVTSVDNCDGTRDISSSASTHRLTGVGDHRVTFRASDRYGNGSSRECRVRVRDRMRPSITCFPHNSVWVDGKCEFNARSFPVTSSDNCDGTRDVSGSASPSVLRGPGNYGVRYYASDSSGNSYGKTCSLHVSDRSPPNIKCPTDFNVDADENCQADPRSLQVTSTDNCDGTRNISRNTNTHTLHGVKLHHVTYSARDGAGNSRSRSCQVRVVDNTKPIMSCPVISVLQANESCEADPSGLRGEATDNCDPYVYARTSETMLQGIGSHNVTFSATDRYSNREETECPIVVVDSAEPVIECPEAELLANESCEADPRSLTGVATDNCDAEFDATTSETTLKGAGPHNVIFSATDASSNRGEKECSIAVVDKAKPSISCPSSAELEANEICEADPQSLKGVATDNCDDDFDATTSQTKLMGTGSHNVMFSATDASSNVGEKECSVLVVDRTTPMITCPSSAELIADEHCKVDPSSLKGVALDNCDPDFDATTSETELQGAGSHNVLFSATDASFNRGEKVCSIAVVDKAKPSISCPSSAELTADENCEVDPSSLKGVAMDNCDPNFDATTSMTQLRGVGSHNVMFSATDSSSNSEQKECAVTVVDTTPPTFDVCPGNLELEAEAGCVAELPLEFMASASDNCGGTVVDWVDDNGNKVSGRLPLGQHFISFRATDVNGNWADGCRSVVTIEDHDDDGLCGDDDLCPHTKDEPEVELKPNHWKLTNQKDADSYLLYEGSKPKNRRYTTKDTGGCSCSQIIEICDYGKGISEFGCPNGVMDLWTGLYDHAGEAPFRCEEDLN